MSKITIVTTESTEVEVPRPREVFIDSPEGDGGYRFSLDENSTLELEYAFGGYATTKITLHGIYKARDYRRLSRFFEDAATYFDTLMGITNEQE